MFAQSFEGFGRPGGPRFGDPFRAGRGMMEPAILGALADKPMHGYEIISYLEEKSHGIWRPSPGSVYPTLQLLEEKDLIMSHQEDGKKTYHLTTAGKTAAQEAASTRAKWREPFSDRFNKAFDQRKTLADAMHAMRRIYRRGDKVQAEELGRAIEAFRDRLVEIEKEEKS